MEPLELLKHIGTAAGNIVTISGCLALCIRPVRERLARFIRRASHMDESEKRIAEMLAMLEQHIEADRDKIVSSELLKKASTELLYDSLDKTYRDYIGGPGIPLSVRQRLVNLYAVYAGLGGNGHGEIMYRELLELPIATEHTPRQPLPEGWFGQRLRNANGKEGMFEWEQSSISPPVMVAATPAHAQGPVLKKS